MVEHTYGEAESFLLWGDISRFRGILFVHTPVQVVQKNSTTPLKNGIALSLDKSRTGVFYCFKHSRCIPSLWSELIIEG